MSRAVGGSAGLEVRLREEAAAVDARLTALADGWTGPSRLGEAMRYSLLAGGKRLRPVLCLWAHDDLAPSRSDAVWRASLALEMIHTYSLIHDDLPAMDDDDLRRGRPSCHRQFDEATAILAGDCLQTEAFGLLAGAGDGATLVGILTRAAGVAGMAAGQQLDLDGHADAETVHRLKTGRLIAASLELGVACAGADARTRELVAAAGEQVGVAFQIIDDVLDVTTPSEQLGKSAGKDRAQGKHTALTQWGGVEGARREAGRRLEASLAQLGQAGLRGPGVTGLLRRLVDRDR